MAMGQHVDDPMDEPNARPNERRVPRSGAYDLIVIGGGSAGLSAAQVAALLGARVALVDRTRLGGECLYTGCVPSKALLHVARLAHDACRARELGLSVHLGSMDFQAVADHITSTIGQVAQRDSAEAYERLGAEVLFGDASFVSPRELSINGHIVRAHAYLICTGSHASLPDIAGLRETVYRTNETIFELRQLPQTLTILGGGPIGVEMAQAFARLGSQVTLVQRADRLLPREEAESSALVRGVLELEGVRVYTETQVSAVKQSGDGKVITVQSADGATRALAAEELLVAVGRTPNVEALGLDAAGVSYDPCLGIATDGYLRTSNSIIYAAGDVRGGAYFTHAAAQQARLAVRNAVTPFRARLDERVLPWTTFTDPEVARVGLTEAEARARHAGDVRVYIQRFDEVDRAQADGDSAGFVKLVSSRKGALLGAHIVGRHAGEYIGELALAMQARLPLGALAATIHVYPTLALAIQQAAGQFTSEQVSRGIVPRMVRFHLDFLRRDGVARPARQSHASAAQA